jgi:Tfp pilus assembly protein PilZ
MSSDTMQGGGKKRRQNRGYRSYKVKYGLDLPRHQAYARRLSEAGLFIATNMIVYPVGSTIIMDIDIGGTVYRATGLVRNAVKIEARYARLAKPGMGVEFTEAMPELKQALSAGG